MTDLPELKTVDTPKGKLAYRESGSGPVLFLMHGLGGSSRSWREQLMGLSDTFRVIAWDCPGYGGSADSARSSPTPDDYADAALALLDELGINEFYLLGHSMGGILAPRMTAKAPRRVGRLVLSATKTGFKGPDADGFRKRLNDFQTLSAEEFGAARAQSMAAEATSETIREELASIASEIRESGYAAAIHLLGVSDNRDTLSNMSLPTLVIAGAEDRIAPVDRTRELKQSLPACEHVVVEDAGHAAYLEKPDIYNALLREFLKI